MAGTHMDTPVGSGKREREKRQGDGWKEAAGQSEGSRPGPSSTDTPGSRPPATICMWVDTGSNPHACPPSFHSSCMCVYHLADGMFSCISIFSLRCALALISMMESTSQFPALTASALFIWIKITYYSVITLNICISRARWMLPELKMSDPSPVV